MVICASIRSTLEQIGLAARSGDVEAYEHRFLDLLNELELASAIVLDGAATARTGKIVELLLVDVLKTVNDNPDLRLRVQTAVHAESTFENLADFLRRHRIQFRELRP
jgi:hypothetical protein